jgi:phage tail sheath protein FI
MPFQVSPGVNVTEVDLTTIIPAVSTSIGAMAGRFQTGPVGEVVTIDSEDTLVSNFGKPDANTAVDFFTAANFLSYSNALRVVRAGNASDLNPSTGSAGFLIKNDDHFDTLTPTDFAYGKSSGAFLNGLRVEVCDSETAFASWTSNTQFDAAPKTSEWATARGASNDELHVIVLDGADGAISGTAGTILEKYSFMSKALGAKDAQGNASYYKDVINNSSKYLRVGSGAPASETSAAFTDGPEMSDATDALALMTGADGLGSVTVNHFGVTATYTANVTAQANTTQDVPAQDEGGTIVKAGKTYVVLDTSVATGTAGLGQPTAKNGLFIAHANTSATKWEYNVVEAATNWADLTVTDTMVSLGSIVLHGDSDANTFVASTRRLKSDGTFIAAITTNYGAAATTDLTYGGTDVPFTGTLASGVETAPGTGDIQAAYDLFVDPDKVDVSLITTSGHDATVKKYVSDNIVDVRKDCIAFVSPDKADVVDLSTDTERLTNVLDHRNNDLNLNTSYAVMDSGWKYQYDKFSDVFRWIPLNGDIAGLCARTDYLRDSWWSPAGYTRGQIKNSVRLAYNPSKAHRNDLYRAGINPVVTFTGQGTILFGDKTLQTRPSAFDRINVRRLFIVLEKAIATAAKFALFEFNDEFTRSQFRNMVEPFLRDIQGRRGITDFKVVCDETNNTGEVIDRNEFVGDIYVKPTRSINFIQLNFVAVRTGVDFSEIVGKF